MPVTLNFSGTPASEVVLDGDLEPAGAQYTIDGNGNLHVVNQTVGLSVTINGYRDQDQLYVYMPGAIGRRQSALHQPRHDLPRRRRATGGHQPHGRQQRHDRSPLRADRDGSDRRPQLAAWTCSTTCTCSVRCHRIAWWSTCRRTCGSRLPSRNVLNLNSNPNIWAEVYAARSDALIAWKEGPGTCFHVPSTLVGSLCVNLGNSSNPCPNPLVDFAYGIDVPHVDAPLSVGYYSTEWGYRHR